MKKYDQEKDCNKEGMGHGFGLYTNKCKFCGKTINEEKQMSQIFDTLDYVKGAQEVGFTQQQAEFQAKELSKWFNNELVTKEFLINSLKEMEMRLTIKVGGMMIAAIGLLTFLLKH